MSAFDPTRTSNRRINSLLKDILIGPGDVGLLPAAAWRRRIAESSSRLGLWCGMIVIALKFRGAEGASNKGVPEMCDYSLQTVKSRPAKVGDKLTTRDFGTCTRGFAAAEDAAVAVCVLPGTELAFSSAVTVKDPRFFVGWKVERLDYATAIFRQVNKSEPFKHHDALEFPDGRVVLLTRLSEGQEATVLQLPARPTTAAEADAQKRIAYVG